jgi:beta-glucanase (GH16 family)
MAKIALSFSGDWQLIWGDEFAYSGAPDPAKWGYETGRIRNNEAQTYTTRPENVRVENGHLVIEAHREAYEGAEYTSASVHTLGKFGFQYGRIEVQAKLPASRGTWPAAWMLSEDFPIVGCPRCGEIDIMEHVGYNPGVVHGTLHQGSTPASRFQEGSTTTVPDFADAFHVYATEWHPDRLDFFVDGEMFWSYPYTTMDRWTFDKRYYLILNLAVGGAWGGKHGIDETAFPQRYLIDYVRVYQPAEYR